MNFCQIQGYGTLCWLWVLLRLLEVMWKRQSQNPAYYKQWRKFVLKELLWHCYLHHDMCHFFSHELTESPFARIVFLEEFPDSPPSGLYELHVVWLWVLWFCIFPYVYPDFEIINGTVEDFFDVSLWAFVNVSVNMIRRNERSAPIEFVGHQTFNVW